MSLDILHQKSMPGDLQREKGFSKKEFRLCVDPCSESAAGKAARSHRLQRGSPMYWPPHDKFPLGKRIPGELFKC